MAAGKKKPEEKDGINKDKTRFTKAAAKKKIARPKKITPDLNVQTPEQLIHELRVHQIELETQIEELRKTQLALEESRDKYLDLYEFAPVGYLTLTDKARITKANLTLATLLLVERRDLVTHGFGQFIAQGELERWDRFLAEVRHDGDKKHSCTLTLKRGDGSPFLARLDGQRIAGITEKTPTVRVAVCDISDLWMAGERTVRQADANRDLLAEIAEREKSERTLQESRENLQAFFNATTDPLVLLAPDGTILAANAITGEAFGAPADTVIGKNAYKLLPPAIVKHRKKIVDRVVKTKKPVEYEDERAGRYLHHYVYPVLGEDGNVRCVAIYAKDITEQRRADAALRGSEEKLTLVMDGVPALLSYVDADLRFIYVNNAYAHWYGRTGQEIIGKKIGDLLEKEVFERALPQYQKVLNGNSVSFENRTFDREGRERFVSVTLTPHFVQEQVCGFFAAITDITGRRQAEAALRESEEKYRTLFESMAPGVFYQRSDGTLIDANPAALSMFGLTSEQFTGRDSYDPRWKVVSETGELLAPEQHPSMIALRSGKPVKDLIVGVYNPARDEMTWLSTNAEPQFRSGEVIPYQVFVTMYDITERRRAEEALKESEQLLSEVFDNANDAIYLLERTPEGPGKYLLVNDKAIQMLGYSKEEFMLMSPKDIVPEDIAKKIMPGVIKKLLNDGHATFESAHRRKDGSIYPVEVSTHTFCYRGKNVDLSLVRDITERKVAEETLKTSEQKFQSLVEHALEGIMILDLQGEILFANNAAARTLEFDDCAELIGRNVMEFVAPESREDVVKDFIEVSHGHDAYLAQYNVISVKGNKFTVESIGKVVSYEGKPADLISIRDITERKQAEKELQESHERFRATIASLDDAIFLVDPVTRLISECNDASTRIFGYSREELIGSQTVFLHVDQAHLEQFSREVNTSYDEPGYYKREFEMRRKDGCVFPTEHFVRPIKDPDGRIQYVVSVVRDITERKRAEVAISESEERIRQITDTITNVFYIHDRGSNRFIYVSPAYETIWKRSCQSLIDNPYSFLESVHPDDLPRLQESIRKELEEGIYVDTDYRIIHPDGSVHWIRSRNFPIAHETGKTIRVAGIAEDITDLKKAELLLKNAKEYAETLIRTANAMVIGLDTHGRITLFNEAAEAITGYTAAELAGRNWFEVIVPKEQYPHVWEEFNRLLTGGLPIDFENPILTKSGEERYIVWKNSEIRDNEQTIGTVSFGIDITERKRAEEALRESESRTRAMLQAIPDLVFRLDRQGVFLDYKADINDLYSQSVPTLVGRCNRDITTPEFADLIDFQIRSTLESGVMQSFEFQLPIPGRDVRDYEARMVASGGNEVTAIVRDITERKQTEEALKDSEERFHSMFERHNSVMLLIDPESGKIIDANLAAAQFYGRSQEELCSQSIDEINTLSKEEVAAERRKALQEKKNFFIFPHRLANGEIRTVEVHSTPIEVGGKAVLFSVISDITERKRAEDALKESERKYRNLVNTLNEGIWYVTPDLITSYLNPRMAEMLGYNVEEMNGRPLTDFIEPDSMRVVEEQVERRKEGHIDQYEIILRKKDGRNLIGRVTASPLLDEKGGFIGSVAGVEDITESKHYEDVLTLANRIFSISNHHQQITSMLDEVVHVIKEYTHCDSVGIRLLDTEGNIPYTSYAGFAPSFYERESPLNVLRDECMCIYVIRGDANPDLPVITSKGSFWCNGTTKFLAGVSDEDKGKTRNVCNEVGYESVALVAIKRGDEILGLIHIADHCEGMVPLETVEVLEDISQALGSAIQRLLAETGIRQSLAEKEVLLREIHHRVKNNLSGIISLIELQISSLTDPVNISLLRDLETRVRSMALVHESLYVTKDLARISTATYTENLTRHLFQVYGKGPEIRYSIDMGEIMMPLETAVPFGLVISEIITNSLKYAFPPSFSCEDLRGEPCTISLRFHREGNDYLLTIADNGIGIPDGQDVAGSRTLGLFLIDFIVKHQLRGSIEINNVRGTAYTIRFPEPAVKE